MAVPWQNSKNSQRHFLGSKVWQGMKISHNSQGWIELQDVSRENALLSADIVVPVRRNVLNVLALVSWLQETSKLTTGVAIVRHMLRMMCKTIGRPGICERQQALLAKRVLLIRRAMWLIVMHDCLSILWVPVRQEYAPKGAKEPMCNKYIYIYIYISSQASLVYLHATESAVRTMHVGRYLAAWCLWLVVLRRLSCSFAPQFRFFGKMCAVIPCRRDFLSWTDCKQSTHASTLTFFPHPRRTSMWSAEFTSERLTLPLLAVEWITTLWLFPGLKNSVKKESGGRDVRDMQGNCTPASIRKVDLLFCGIRCYRKSWACFWEWQGALKRKQPQCTIENVASGHACQLLNKSDRVSWKNWQFWRGCQEGGLAAKNNTYLLFPDWHKQLRVLINPAEK